MLTEEERKDKWGRAGSSNPMYGKTHTKEAREKISKAHIGRSYTLGQTRNDETKKKMSDIAKERTGIKNPFYGKHHSDETKKKLSESRKGVLPTNSRKIIADGVEYVSLTECARQLGVTPALIVYRIKSEKYNYHYL